MLLLLLLQVCLDDENGKTRKHTHFNAIMKTIVTYSMAICSSAVRKPDDGEEDTCDWNNWHSCHCIQNGANKLKSETDFNGDTHLYDSGANEYVEDRESFALFFLT